MDKHAVHQRIIDTLAVDLDVLQRAAQTAYEAATDEENIAENKYDTLGLEASYLATGQARRVEEIRQALKQCRELPLRPYDDQAGIQLGALLTLEAENGNEQQLFLAPDAAGLKIEWEGRTITVISPRSPLGQALLGKFDGDEVQISVGAVRQRYTVTAVS
ncbi:transcription elongation factor GreAB [Pseudomonas gingeri NCPPB 3146 = LMG 5327]|uniref:GreA/GreB family elongation factor n=2 Tax=Pseudomonas gingeri TaxID=117681 RepID=A0A7Y7Y1X5_9PSED|nr:MULTISPECIES: GreA/GreB family elongation factor [Pseudomonas]NWC16246.1 GreA/GreB family elongation factor [Pseudomonas gingeri]NWE71968.1 GreA/GreB family elongation factor [Pseudomonas gingeri]PNQ90550.1 transcription elongation factor GreAB [Pseudomonas gingeri NCPPB 3146 = LMG 5327]BBP75714.1 elongation factor GreAB [Pseudomonas sp. Ost2]